MRSHHHFPEIDRLRGLAILMVIYDHLAVPPFGLLAPYIHPMLRETWTGVDLFFAISGFVVFLSLQRSNSALEFYKRRFWRIAPLALLCSAVPTAVVWMMGGFSEMTSMEQVGQDFLAIVTLRFNYAFAYATKGALLLSPYWSLCVEEHFYLLLPLFVLFLRNRTQRLLVGLAVILASPLALRPWVYEWTQPPHQLPYFRAATHCRLDGLLVGVLLAEYWRASKGKGRNLRWKFLAGNALSLLAIAALVLIPNLMKGVDGLNWGNSATAAISAGLVWLASRDAGYVFELPGLRRLLSVVGQHSYALYLLHMPAYYLAVGIFRANLQALQPSEVALIVLTYGGLLASLAYACRRWIELPLMEYGRGFSLAKSLKKISRALRV
ncbi:MAG TPA: acyltransferase [Bdellovibrionota bacterium]|jgi:peptidoglycan/LPS O-acetylase OafA/YrhL